MKRERVLSDDLGSCVRSRSRGRTLVNRSCVFIRRAEMANQTPVWYFFFSMALIPFLVFVSETLFWLLRVTREREICSWQSDRDLRRGGRHAPHEGKNNTKRGRANVNTRYKSNLLKKANSFSFYIPILGFLSLIAQDNTEDFCVWLIFLIFLAQEFFGCCPHMCVPSQFFPLCGRDVEESSDSCYGWGNRGERAGIFWASACVCVSIEIRKEGRRRKTKTE